MSGHVLPAVWLLLAATGLSGCAGDAGTESTSVDLDAAASAEVGTGSLSILILVTDDSLTPIADVNVIVKELEATVLTDDAGAARFDGVEPGTYTLYAQRLGYESAAKRVDVTFESANVRFELAPIAAVEAYYFTFIFKGQMTCGGGLIVVAFTFCGNYTQPTPVGNVSPPPLDPNHKVFFDQDGTPLHKTIIAEMVWRPGTAVSARSMQLHLWQNHRCTPVCNPEFRYGSSEGPSPVVLRSDGPFSGLKKGAATITHTVWTPFSTSDPPYVVLTIQQPFTLYSTHFFGAEAPEGFMARPDA